MVVVFNKILKGKYINKIIPKNTKNLNHMQIKMYLIVVYDINEKRVNKVCKFLRTYLYWVQNSVFEGDVTNAGFEKIKTRLKKIIDEKEDSIIFFKMPSGKDIDKEILGIERNEISNIL